MFETYIIAVAQIGFPAALCIILIIRNDSIIRQNTRAINRLEITQAKLLQRLNDYEEEK